MKHAITFAVASLAVTLLTEPARATPPKNRVSCAIGYSALALDERASVEPIDVLDIQLGADGGPGVAADCAVGITAGVYLYGGYRQNDGSFDVTLTFDDEAKTGSFDLDAERWRIGLGYEHALGERVAAYGQIGYASADYDYEPVFVVLDSGGAQFGPANLQSSDGGLDLEAGVTWQALDRLKLGGFVRFAQNHQLSFDEHSGFSFSQRNEDAVMVGSRARLELVGPFHIAGDVVLGDIEEVVIGVGVDF